jgi:protein gp37
VSIENRRYVHRADLLRATPAAVRFISAEPLLGPLVPNGWGCRCFPDVESFDQTWPDGYEGPALTLGGIDWLIVGGESGPSHRPIREEWVADLCQSAEHARTAFFFKQWGGRTPKAGGRELDGRTWDEMPEMVA